MFIFYFICDVLQSLLGAMIIKFFTQGKEAEMWKTKRTIEDDIEKPKSVDRPAFVMFCLKAVFLLLGFIFVAVEIGSRLGNHNPTT